MQEKEEDQEELVGDGTVCFVCQCRVLFLVQCIPIVGLVLDHLLDGVHQTLY